MTAFEPGRISDNFMKRFDSPTVNEEVPVSRPKKKLISFDQVMRRVSIRDGHAVADPCGSEITSG